MQRERVTDDVYVFISDLYVQVTASILLTNRGAVLIDTLLYPEETLQIKRFVERNLKTKVRYVINTHFHADHTTGTCFFENATVISHRLCRDLLDSNGRESLARMKSMFSEMEDIELKLPNIVFDDRMMLKIGDKTIEMWSSPGHSMDSIVCLEKDSNILFAADTVMPIPYFVGGDYDAFLQSLEILRKREYETIIQGHGEVVLRGEAEDKIASDIRYLRKLRSGVDKALAAPDVDAALKSIKLEKCGKSRILLNGAVQELHRANVFSLAEKRRKDLAHELDDQ